MRNPNHMRVGVRTSMEAQVVRKRTEGMKTLIHAGFTYHVEHVRRGQVIDTETAHNLLPNEGLDHVIDVLLKGGTAHTTWYLGLFEGDYTPGPTDTAATFPTAASEFTAYDEATRQPVTFGAISLGGTDNNASRAEFTSTGSVAIYGGFLTPASAKEAATGPLLSAARFSSPKLLEDDDVLRVIVGFSLLNF